MGLAIPPTNRLGDLAVKSAFEISQTDCQTIIDLHKDSQNPHKEGRVISDGDNVVNLNTRDVDVWVIHENNRFIDELLIKAALEVNKDYGFQISGIIERPQLLKYEAPSKGYDWHVDIGAGDASTRKISISILLNDDYRGGELGFFAEKSQYIKPDRGMAVCFPSFLPHCVMPVEKGTRWSLVSWINGEPFS